MEQEINYMIVGNGRVATHFRHYFDLLKIPFVHWHRQLDTAFEDNVGNCTHIILLISDGAIETFISQHPVLKTKTVIHCSGALTTPLAHGAHPLTTFSKSLYTLDEYTQIPFITELEGSNFNELFPQLKNANYAIERSQKPLYHALSVVACNFSILLWQKLFTGFENDLHIPADVGKPILKQTLTNLLREPNIALTGPLARQDFKTIAANLKALEGDPYAGIYQAFVDAYQAIQRQVKEKSS